MPGAMTTRASVYGSIFLVGFCSLIAQVVLLREMVVTFYGNELSIGVMLGSWLLWTGLGSLGLGRFARRLREPRLWLAWALLACAAVLIGTVIGAKCLKILVGIRGTTVVDFLTDPARAASGLSEFFSRPERALSQMAAAREALTGQLRPLGSMLGSSLALLGPFCLLNGFLFPLACRAARPSGGDSAAGAGGERSVGLVYALEAAGAAAGGATYTFALVEVDWLHPLLLAWMLGLAYAVCAFGLALGHWRRVSGWVLLAGAAGVFVALCATSMGATSTSRWLCVFPEEVERAYWEPFDLRRTRDSRYGRVAVVRQAAQVTVYENGALGFSYPDPPAAESVAHLPMLEHPLPRRVLLLGGGPGVVEEILKYRSVETLTYVELDPQVMEASLSGAPFGDDPRVESVVVDGRAFVKRTRARYDVVIVALGPPTTAQANRHYTLEWFREVVRVLEPGGLIAFRAAGGESYLSETSRRLLACLHDTLAAALPHVIVFPGAECTFLASNRAGVLTYHVDTLDDRMTERGIRTSYVDASLWGAALTSGRLEELKGALRAKPAPALNRDLSPRCYYFEAQRWSEQLRSRGRGGKSPRLDLGQLLAYLDERPAIAPLALFGLVAVASVAVPLMRRRRRDGAIAFAVTSSGLIQIAAEFVVLLGFQVVCGYVYQAMGVLIGAFMLGMTLGALLSSRWVRKGLATWRRLELAQILTCVYPLCLYGVMFAITRSWVTLPPAMAGLAFGVMAVAAGAASGLLFPLAAALRQEGGASAGTLYGLDLFGSCLGALAVSSVLVPTFGLGGACAILAGFGALGLAGLAAAGGRRASKNG